MPPSNRTFKWHYDFLGFLAEIIEDSTTPNKPENPILKPASTVQRLSEIMNIRPPVADFHDLASQVSGRDVPLDLADVCRWLDQNHNGKYGLMIGNVCTSEFDFVLRLTKVKLLASIVEVGNSGGSKRKTSRKTAPQEQHVDPELRSSEPKSTPDVGSESESSDSEHEAPANQDTRLQQKNTPAQQSQSLKESDSTFTCNLCFESKPISDEYKCPRCKAVSCFECNIRTLTSSPGATCFGIIDGINCTAQFDLETTLMFKYPTPELKKLIGQYIAVETFNETVRRERERLRANAFSYFVSGNSDTTKRNYLVNGFSRNPAQPVIIRSKPLLFLLTVFDIISVLCPEQLEPDELETTEFVKCHMIDQALQELDLGRNDRLETPVLANVFVRFYSSYLQCSDLYEIDGPKKGRPCVAFGGKLLGDVTYEDAKNTFAATDQLMAESFGHPNYVTKGSKEMIRYTCQIETVVNGRPERCGASADENGSGTRARLAHLERKHNDLLQSRISGGRPTDYKAFHDKKFLDLFTTCLDVIRFLPRAKTAINDAHIFRVSTLIKNFCQISSCP